MYYKYCIESRDLSLYTETIRQFYANFYGFYFSLHYSPYFLSPLLEIPFYFTVLLQISVHALLAELRYKDKIRL